MTEATAVKDSASAAGQSQSGAGRYEAELRGAELSEAEPRGAELRIENVSFGVGGISILEDVSLTVRPGELMGIIGPNGAGKSSLFNCISGIYVPTVGRIALDGQPLTGLRPVAVARRGVARTFQNLALFDNLNVADNLMLGRHRLMRTGFATAAVWFGRARREEAIHRQACAELVELLGLDAVAHLPVGLLPYGAQKRVELGRALASSPDVLLLDEPVAGMNTEETEQMSAILRNIHQQLDITIVLVEHDVHMVVGLAERICAINFGQVVTVDEPQAVVSHPTVVEAYLGSEWS